MIDLTSIGMTVEADALEHLPPDWLGQLNRGMRGNYLVGYDSLLDEAYVWFDSNRDDAVHIPLNALFDVVIDDRSGRVIGFVARKFAQFLLMFFPQAGKVMIRDRDSDALRLPGDIAMTPIQQLSTNIPDDLFRRTLDRATRLIAA
jgi:hypothetical protein